MTSIPATQIPVGLPTETEPAAETSSDRPDEQATAEATSFAALLLQQSTPQTTPIVDATTETIVPVNGIEPVGGALAEPVVAQEGLTTPVTQLPITDPESAIDELSADLVPAESLEVDPLAGQLDQAEVILDELPQPEVTSAVDTETSVPFATELENFQQEESLSAQQLEDPDAETAELLDDTIEVSTDTRPSSELPASPKAGDSRPDVSAVVAAAESENAVDRRRPTTEKAVASAGPATATAETSLDAAATAISLDALSTESVSRPDTFAPEPVPVHGLQKIVNELIAEAETVVDNKTIAVQFEEPHIGSVLIQMAETDDGLTVSVAADDDLTLEMLQTGSQQLESTLKDNNIELVEITSLPPEMNFQQQGQPDSPFQQQAPQIYQDTARSGQTGNSPGSPVRRLTPADQLDFRA